MLTAFGLSHAGHVRALNEDAWHSSLPLGLFVVADGMGGHNAGEVASTLAIETILAFMRSTADGGEATWPFPIDPSLSMAANRLRTAIRLANRRVFRTAQERPDCSGMGTTVVAATVDGHALALGSVGDSRVYSLVDGRLTQLTTDDTWLGAGGPVTPESDAGRANHPLRHVLDKAVGLSDDLEVSILERTLRVDETLLLCSDGLHGELSDPTIAAILGSDAGVPALAERLVQAVLDGRARDNVTAVVVRLEP